LKTPNRISIAAVYHPLPMERVRDKTTLLERLRAAKGCNLLLCDLDFLMSYNDELGHSIGDEALRAVEQVIEHIAPNSLRYGGDEFVILADDGDRVGEDIRAGVENLNRRSPKLVSPARLTISVGVASRPANGNVDDWLAMAESALHAAKNAGRNRVCVIGSNGARVINANRPAVEIRADKRYS